VKVLSLVLLGALLAPASAAAAPVRTPPAVDTLTQHPDLWATVNACDTVERPDSIGIRASMPGRGPRETLAMRFRVQYLDPADRKWHFVKDNADSGRQVIGRTRTAAKESGWDFRFKPPAGGGVYVLRGHVTFTWSRRGRTMRKISEVTERGHSRRRGSDPPGYSAAECRIG
jgi:hypothetical protein